MSVDKLFRLDGRLALVTGSSTGIGLALARALGQAGAARAKEAMVAIRTGVIQIHLAKVGFQRHYTARFSHRAE